MRCFSLGVICDNIEEINELVYPFHNEFVGYFPKEYYENNVEEKKFLKFESFSREMENEWKLLSDNEKKTFKNDIVRFADVKYGYYYNEEKSDIGYYKNENGKMICFSIGGTFSGMINVKSSFGLKKQADYAKIKDIIIPDKKQTFGTYAVINDGNWISVDDYVDRDEWFYLHFRRIIKKADKEKLFVVIECCYNDESNININSRACKSLATK